MKPLREYFNKQVKIIDVDNKEFIGFVETYTPALDSDDNIDGISIKPKGAKHLVNLCENEIKSIEVI